MAGYNQPDTGDLTLCVPQANDIGSLLATKITLFELGFRIVETFAKRAINDLLLSQNYHI